MVTTETFHHAVFAASPAAESPEIREYAAWRVCNTVEIGHELGAEFAVYWPGSLGYQIQGAVEETQTLQVVCGSVERGLRARHRGRAPERPSHAEALHGSQAVRAPGRDSAAHQRRDAGLHQFRFADASRRWWGSNPEYLHELMWGGAPRAALARALMAGKLWHFDINDGYRLKHDVDIAVGLVNPLDWLNVLVLLRSHGYNGPFNLDYKPPRTTSNFGVFKVSFPTAVDRFITLWEMAGEVHGRLRHS